MSWNSISLTKPSSIAAAAALADLQALATQVGAVMVHPFQFAVGEGERPMVLAFPNAVEALAIKLAEIKPPSATCLAFTATSLSGLNSVLKNAIEATGLQWLLTPQQRSELLNSLDSKKWDLPTASETPVQVRQTHTILHVGKIAECYQVKNQQLAKEEGLTAVADIATELANLDTKKQQYDSEVDAAFDAIDIGSADGYALKLSGSDVASQLRDSGGPGAEKSMTVIICFFGESEDLKVIEEWVGA
jgi:hypothetical protein